MGRASAAFRLTGNYDFPAPHTSLSIQIQVTFLMTKDPGKFRPGYRMQATFLLTTQGGHGLGILATQAAIAVKGRLTYRI